MPYQYIEYSASEGIGRAVLNRPEKLNALNAGLQEELLDCLRQADEDPEVRVVTLRANGRAFCSGYDVSEPASPQDVARRDEVRDNIRMDLQRLRGTPGRWAQVWNLSKPVIAGVHGYCLAGGTDLALHCDIVIAAEDAQIGFPAVRSM